ncbi:MAG: tRNA pseudouridine(54/55) synthase Pus10 [Candidatus Bathyarchaeota archaeon]|nr:tRNA pseudouridine(54/55) synthase Pus10 [Candidatus Bathyarchaeota archaeon]
MDLLEKAFELLNKYPLCDHCLGRQFALLGYSMENNVRGQALKVCLTMQANDLATAEKCLEGVKRLKVLATNGFSREAQETLKHLKKRVSKQSSSQRCFLCDGKFELIDGLTDKSLQAVDGYEFTTFLVGIELPTEVEEREDEFKAQFNIAYGESLRHEFGRVFGKAIGKRTGKETEYLKPDMVVVINPFTEQVRIQPNPLFVTGRYRKLARDIPQSKWFCSRCRGRGCEQCGGTGKMYPESVEEYASKPLLEATEGEDSFFHASGREDIDARMLGSGRPFVIEVSKPKKRSVDLKHVEDAVNASASGKVEVFDLQFTNKDVVRHLKKGEGAVKEYALLAEFEKDLSDSDLRLIEETFSNVTVKQQTPRRVMHRRADIVRERYIYKVKVKKVSLKRALLEIRCQGGLYVKELVSGDDGRTQPNVADLLGNPAKTLKLDVLNVIME